MLATPAINNVVVSGHTSILHPFQQECRNSHVEGKRAAGLLVISLSIVAVVTIISIVTLFLTQTPDTVVVAARTFARDAATSCLKTARMCM